MTPIHIFYRTNSAPLFRRMVNELPFTSNGVRIDEQIDSHEGWLVLADPNESQFSTRIPWERRALCLNEPSAMNALPLSFINQFGLLISPYRVSGFRGKWHKTHTGLPWFFGAELKNGKLLPTLTLNELRDLPIPIKTNTVSVVLSNKVFHAGHRKRLKLLELLKEQIGDRLLIYGRGINEIGDKADAILPSALHLALENTVEPSYWTEKLSDTFLGYSLPVYGGCPDIHQWFPSDAMLTIDPERPEDAVKTIRDALDQGLYSQRLPAICEARKRVLNQESAYHKIAEAVACHLNATPNLSTMDVIHPPERGGVVNRIGRELRRVYFQVTFRQSALRSEVSKTHKTASVSSTKD